MAKSPSLSFKGFKLQTNTVNALKNCVFVALAAVLADTAVNGWILNAVGTFVGTAILKAAEYFIKSYK